uniref:Uncharacterized protein n=1 Tax=viral metagenome TaxID=1070528 RepID=A0A6M3JQG1_9ZZZZ
MTKKASPVGGLYTYRFECRMRDPSTGRTRVDMYGVTTDDLLTPEEALEETKDKIVEGQYEPYEEFVRGRLIAVLRR